MDNLAEDIWKTTLYSLVVASAVVGLMRYIDQDPWWQINQFTISEESENNPLVYYSIKNSNDETSFKAGLFFMNTLQQRSSGLHGAFENVLPGQALSLIINFSDQSIRIPAFRLQEREIRHFVFAYQDNKLEYLGSHSRLREVKYPRVLNLEENKLASANVLKVIENYQPIEKVEAKENIKTSATGGSLPGRQAGASGGQDSGNNDIHNFPRNINPLTNHFPFDIFLHFR